MIFKIHTREINGTYLGNIYIYIYVEYLREYIRNIHKYLWYETIRNTGAAEGVPPSGSVFLMILYHKYSWIFLIYSLYIPYLYVLHIFHLFSFVCFGMVSVSWGPGNPQPAAGGTLEGGAQTQPFKSLYNPL